MSRVHDALRRAEQLLEANGNMVEDDVQERIGPPEADLVSLVVTDEAEVAAEQAPVPAPIDVPRPAVRVNAVARSEPKQLDVDWRNFLTHCRNIPFRPAPETHLIDLERPHEVPAEEFRSLRTRLNHLQGQQDLHSIVVTSASPAEGKTFTAVNLALAQSQLETPVLLADLDLRRPVVHNLFQCERAPGFSDFILGKTWRAL